MNFIFEVVREMEDIERDVVGLELLKGFLMVILFYEFFICIRFLFEFVMKRLGGEVLMIENVCEFFLVVKGEILEG